MNLILQILDQFGSGHYLAIGWLAAALPVIKGIGTAVGVAGSIKNLLGGSSQANPASQQGMQMTDEQRKLFLLNSKLAQERNPERETDAAARYAQNIAGRALAQNTTAAARLAGPGRNNSTKSMPIMQQAIDGPMNELSSLVFQSKMNGYKSKMDAISQAAATGNPGQIAQTYDNYVKRVPAGDMTGSLAGLTSGLRSIEALAGGQSTGTGVEGPTKIKGTKQLSKAAEPKKTKL